MEVTLTGFIIIVLAAFIAGWIDALIGGGGLILIPTIMAAAPGLAPVVALATNKCAACMGTASAAWTLNKKLGFDWKKQGPFILLALPFSALGALGASAVNKDLMRPIVILLLLVVGIFVALRPQFGTCQGTGSRYWPLIYGAVALIALYDGCFGPGTGMFLIMAFTALCAQDFVGSSANAKLINTCTNIGALCIFIIHGNIYLPLAIAAAVANIIGAQCGARTILRGGPRFVRYALLALVLVMCIYLTITQIRVMS